MSEVSLSTYPTTIDTFDRYSDLDATTMAMAEIYKGYIDAGQYDVAATYLTDNPSLEACGITAEIINKHSDAIVAIETYLNQTKNTVDTLSDDVDVLQQDMITVKDDITSSDNGIRQLQAKHRFFDGEKIIIGYVDDYTLYEYFNEISISENPISGTITITDIDFNSSQYIKYPYQVTGFIRDGSKFYPIGYDNTTIFIKAWIENGVITINYNGMTNADIIFVDVKYKQIQTY